MAKKKDVELNKKDTKSTESNFQLQGKSIIYFALAGLLFALVLYPGENVWSYIHYFIKGVFGWISILWPVLFTYLGYITAKEKQIASKVRNKFIMGSVAVVLLSTLSYLIVTVEQGENLNFFRRLGQLYTQGSNPQSGSFNGLVSGILGYPLALLFGYTASTILCLLALVVVLMYIFSITPKAIIEFFARQFNVIKSSFVENDFERTKSDKPSVIKKLSEKVTTIKENGLDKKSNIHLQKQGRDDHKNKSKDKQFGKYPITLSENNITSNNEQVDLNDVAQALEIVSKSKSNISQNRPIDDIETNEPSNEESREKLLDAFNKYNDVESTAKENKSDTESKSIALDINSILTGTGFGDGSNNEKKSKKQQLQDAEADIARQVVQHSESNGDYRFPPVDLLYPRGNSNDTEKAMEELERNGNKLDSTLKSFGVNARIINICRGPSVTRFEVQPAPGVKISKITKLADDIALNLAASGVRIEAPIPGKSAVGIEVPNKVVTTVSMRELIESPSFRNAKGKLSIVFGKDISGKIIVSDLSKMPHLLIAGTTGSGKSVCVNSILISIIYKASPEDVKMLLIDPKMVEFSKYKGIPHLLIPVVTDPKKAAGALNWAVNEMENRYKEFAAFGVRDIGGYNKMVESYNKIRAERTPEELEADPILNEDGIPIPDKKMFSIVIAIDEFADLMMTAPSEVETSICRLAQKARAAGMHLVVATQRPTVNVITGLIKANIPSRISLRVSSQTDSRTVIDMGGAEKLIGHGDMLFAPIGEPKPIRVQGGFSSDSEIENVTDYIKMDAKAGYNMQVQEEIDKITEQTIQVKGKDNNMGGGDDGFTSDDVLMEEAIKLVVEAGQASTSLLQRRLRLGYARAGRLIDEMEQMGIVGPHVGSKSREVLMTYQQWLERNNSIS
ncbi:MAG: DNA translocase FtsK [Acutalibacteraceae bacterium]